METMNIDTIIQTREDLESQLRFALSTMERSDKIKNIRLQIIENQQNCPHYSAKYNWTIADNICPYCGKIMGG